MELIKSEMRLLEALRLARLGNWELDPTRNAIWGSKEALHIYGIEFTSQDLSLDDIQERILPEYRDLVSEKLHNLLWNKEKFDIEFKIKRENTKEGVFIRAVAAPELDKDGTVVRAIGIIQDITEQKNKEAEILYLSYYDQLTGVYSRSYYENNLMRMDTERNYPLSIIMGDVNGLKLVNDSFGHAKGDELLKKAASALKKSCRADDIIARWGGDEFVILLPRTDETEAKKLIQRIKYFLSQEKVESIELSVSFGSGTKSHANERIADIMKSADDEVYKHKLNESSHMKNATVELIMKMLYEKSDKEMHHSKRVSALCEAIAIQLGYNQEDVMKIKMTGLMHDIGKIGIDETILNKPYQLDVIECNEMKRHSEIGYRILSTVNEFSELANVVLEHQEKWDGSGYPRGLKGEEISRQARIIAIADSYDAMTSEKAYGKGLSQIEAVSELKRCAGTQFDPAILEIFIEKVLKV